MIQCAIYERTEGGTLQRLDGARAEVWPEDLRAYPHAESLQGWPESRVHWTSKHGPCFGVAPIEGAADTAQAPVSD